MRLILLLLLLATPLCAEAESNFGRVILANSDAIVLAVASAKRTKIGGAIRVELTVSETLYGDKVASGVSMFFSNPDSLLKDEAMRALFALKKLSDGGYKLVGKPMLTPESGTESAEKIRVVKAFVALEAEEAGKGRTKAFWKLLQAHIKAGGFSAEDAAIELIFVARDRSDTVTLERFESVVEAEETAKGNLTKQAKADLHLARKGMVETR
ncbi:hypothetical protein OAU50_07885, partial [Planctomycetota bacterium]|nr:hypothetical protein [Planctomycetota bacterium]